MKRNSNQASEASASRHLPESCIKPFGYTGMPTLVITNLWAEVTERFDNFIDGTESFLKKNRQINITRKDIFEVFKLGMNLPHAIKNVSVTINEKDFGFEVHAIYILTDNSTHDITGYIRR